MRYFNSFSGITKKVIIAAIVFLFYGYLCRLIGLYFFWESKTIGWILFWLSIIFILFDIIKGKKLKNRKTSLEKAGIGLCIFIIIMKGVFFFAIRQTAAFENAVVFIKTSQVIKSKAGTVSSIFLVPFGAISTTHNSRGSAGEADLHFIIKGSKKKILI